MSTAETAASNSVAPPAKRLPRSKSHGATMAQMSTNCSERATYHRCSTGLVAPRLSKYDTSRKM